MAAWRHGTQSKWGCSAVIPCTDEGVKSSSAYAPVCVITARQHLSQCSKAAFHRQAVPCASAAAAPSEDGSTAPPETRAVLRSIRSVMRHGRRRPAACQGAVQLTTKIVVYGQHQAGHPFAVQLPSVDAAALQPLMDACEPAEAADPGSNKPDDSNQQVMILPADRFATSFDLAAHNILRDVRSLLVPDAQSLTARLRQLTVCGPGGGLNAHQDTPRSDNHFGLLIVCLPFAHQGGGMIHHKGRLKVEPVTRGHQVTLTYELIARSTRPADMPATPVVDPSTTESSALFGALHAAVSSPTFMPAGGTLGIACSQKYHHRIKGSRLMPGMLKGQDLLAYIAAQRLQLQPALKYVFFNDHIEDEIRRWPTYSSDEEEDDAGGPPRDWYQIIDIYEDTMLSDSAPVSYSADEHDRAKAFLYHKPTAAQDVTWLNEAGFRFDSHHWWVLCEEGTGAWAKSVRSATAILLKVPPMDSSGHRLIAVDENGSA